MKRYRFRFFRFGRPRRNVHVRGTSVLFKRFSSFEGLELRSMLTGSSLLADSALISTNDPYASPIEHLSLASMLSSTLGSGDNDAPAAAPLAANATDDSDSNAPPVADPLVDGNLVNVSIVLEDLNGGAITEITAGDDFIVKIFVKDARTDPEQDYGVVGAFVGLTYDTSLISLVDSNSLVIAEDFTATIPGSKDTSTAGSVKAGGTFIPFSEEDLPPFGSSQLLWTVQLRANASGAATFNTTFETFDGNAEWLVIQEDDVLTSANVTQDTETLTVNDPPTISVNDVSQVETNANSNFVFTVSLSATSTQQVTVVYNTTAGTATAGSDFTATSGTLVFEPGVVSKEVTVAVLGDTNSEADETFNVVLSNPTNATLADAAGVGTILDDDAPLLIFQDVSQFEQDGVNTMVFTVGLSKAATSNVVVQYNTANGTALAGSDYTATGGTLTFTAGGALQQFITVTVNGDAVEEDNETFQVVLTNPTGAEFETDGTATGTILNDDGPVLGFDPVNASLVEGDSGQTFMVFTVTLTAANDQTTTVVYNTANGTATAGSDYTATSGTLTFSGTTLSQTVTVAILGDEVDEADEAFSLVLSSPDNATIAANPGIGTILDDDGPAISLSGPASVNENAGNYVVTATLAAASPQTVTVVWSTANGTATAGSDYTAASGTLTFAPGQTTALITVSLTGDEAVEPNETFTINLSNPVNGELGGQSQFNASIANDDNVPVVSVVGPASQNEGNTGSTPFVFTVNLSKAGTETITVVFNTANAIALAGSDYTATSGTLTFDVGETSKTVTVLVTGDILHEVANETFRLNLASPSGATLGTSTATAVINDDDTQPAASISDVIATEGDSGTKQFVFTVTLSNPSVNTVTVRYATQDGTAAANGDYTATSGTLTFAPDELTKVITVNVVGDLFNEENETFSVILSSPVEATIGDSTGIGTIQDETSDNINVVPSTVAGKVFIDTNSNGEQNGLEKSLAGITVNLTGAATLSTTTGADGSYVFGSLNPGTYTVKFVLPSQYRDGAAILGNSGGTQVEDGYTFTIESPGGVTATGYHFATSGLLPQFVSMRQFLASYLADLSEGEAQVSVSINTVTNPINASNANNTTISGTGSVGATISVVASDGTNSTVAQTTTVGANGTWSISSINVLTLADGTITYTVTATQDGTTDTDTITATKDTVVPDVAVTTVTNPINSNNAADTAISGTGTPNATISVIVTDGTNFTSAFTATVGAGGTWSIGGINVSSLANGTLTYNVTATDTVGNTKTASITSLKDTEAPTVAVTSATDPINAANQNNVTISGTGTVGATISVNITDSATDTSGPHTTTVGANGTWSITGINLSTLADGTITFTVVATDGANNTSPPTTETSTKDTTTEAAISSVTDPINAANQSNTSISGTGEPGATISVVVSIGTSSTDPVTTVVAENGTWSITGIDVSDLPDGTLTYTVTATDEAGNTDEADIEADKDTVAPTVEIDEVTDPIGMSNETAVAISGTSEAGSLISVVVSDGTTTTTAVTATADAEGNWSITTIDVSDLDDGTLTFTVTASDEAGNTATDTITAEKTTVDVAEVTDPITQANEDEVNVSGTGQIGATVSVVATDGVDSTLPVTTTIDSEGNWTVTIDVSGLADGAITFNVTATQGDDSSTTSATATKDTEAEGEILGATNPVNIANQTAAAINGTAEVGSTVSIVVTSGVVTTNPITPTVAEDGTWSATGINLSDLPDAEAISYTVTITDTLGNVNVYTVTALKDTDAPDVDAGEVTDPIGIAEADSVSISGTGEVGATISVVVTDGTNSTTAATTTVDSEGNWTIAGIDVSALDDGTLTFNVTATDVAGNTATDNSLTAVKTTVAVEEVTDPITQANADEVVVTGTGQVDASISVVATNGMGETTPVVTTIDSEGNWTVTIDVSDLDDGTITFTVTASEGEDSVETSITAEKDTVAEGEILEVTDPVTAANAANTFLTGTAELGATVSITATDGITTTDPIAAIAEAGIWAITGVDVSSLADSTITYRVTVTDALGNVTIYEMTAEKDTETILAIIGVTDPIDIALSDSVSISGTGEVGATISVVVTDGVNSTAAVTTTVDSEGNWSIDDLDVSTLDDGTLTFTVTATDLVGNTDTDTITAEKVTLAITGFPDIISQVNEDEVVISGTGEVGASVVVEATDGVVTITSDAVTIDENGEWSVTLNLSTLNDDVITFNVKATVGDDSVEKSTTTQKDTVANGEILTATNPINADNVVNATLTGTTEVGSTVLVQISDGTTILGPLEATVAGDGTWSITGLTLTSLLDGAEITYTAFVDDTKGNRTLYTAIASKDTVPPELSEPSTPPLNIVNSPDYFMTGGTTEPGATISVTFTDENELAVTIPGIVDAESDWSFENADLSSLADGDITIKVVATDAAGNTTELTLLRTKDTDAPTVDATTVDPAMINAATDEAVTISGTGEPGATVSVAASDGVLGVEPDPVVVIDEGGNWSMTLDVSSLADGTITFTATATDNHGNTSTDTITAEKDTVTSVTLNAPNAVVSAANAASFGIYGSREFSSLVSVSVTDGVTTIARDSTTGTAFVWTIADLDLSSLSDGPLTITATATDLFGNTAMQQLVVQKDTTTTVTISDVTDPIDVDNQASTTISGTGEVGATISVTASDGVDSTIAFSIVVDQDGNWSITGIDVSALVDGTITYTVTATDTAGNTDQQTITADKDTAAEPLALHAAGDDSDDSGAAFDEDEDWLSFD